jgi:hypothetical protein
VYFKEERGVLHTVNRSKANWMDHILRRNCFLKYVIEGWIEVTGRRGRRRKKHWMTLKKERIVQLKEEAPDRNV